eukprot:11200718-Karenia_brevis.AAC.1
MMMTMEPKMMICAWCAQGGTAARGREAWSPPGCWLWRHGAMVGCIAVRPSAGTARSPHCSFRCDGGVVGVGVRAIRAQQPGVSE